MANVLASQAYAFADGTSGKSLDLGSAPSVGQWDILCINSNTVMDSVTSSGGASWSALETAVANQGAYVYGRKATGGELTTVVVDTNGNEPTSVIWLRVGGLDAVDASPTSNTQSPSSVAGSTPSHNTGALSATGEFVVAFGALHSIGAANQSAPVWSSGYTGLLTSVQGSGITGVRGYVATKDGAGTAAETPSVSWSGDGAFNRYMLTAVFSAATGATGELAGTGPVGTAALAGGQETAAALAGTGPIGTALLAGTVVTGGVVARPRTGWNGLAAIYRNADAELRRDAAGPPTNCPNDGTALVFVRGEHWCPFDGWIWGGEPVTW